MDGYQGAKNSKREPKDLFHGRCTCEVLMGGWSGLDQGSNKLCWRMTRKFRSSSKITKDTASSLLNRCVFAACFFAVRIKFHYEHNWDAETTQKQSSRSQLVEIE
jgi:hypothetical protein